MAHPRVLHILTLVFLLSMASCNLAGTNASPTPTQTSLPVASPTSTQIPTIEPTSPPTPAPTFTPSGVNLYLPNGIAAYSPVSSKAAYYDLQGQLLGEVQTPNLATGALQQAAIAGKLIYSPGPVLPPLVYFNPENGGELWVNDNNQASLLIAAPNFFNIIGVPGKPLVAYTLLEYTDIGLRSTLYISDLQNLPTARGALETTNPESYAIKPLVISTNDDQPAGVWYTTQPWGIGGDIVFEPREGLNYIDMTTYQIKTLLDITKDPVGISDDQTWVAYTPATEIGPINIIHNFDNSAIVTFPLRPDSDRGSGNAVFSPDNRYIAWKEAGGTITAQPPTFHETIRIGAVDGSIIAEIPDTSLLQVSGFSDISWIEPLGWLDAQTLALEVRGASIENACIVSVKSDGSGSTFIAPGSFIGFLYP